MAEENKLGQNNGIGEIDMLIEELEIKKVFISYDNPDNYEIIVRKLNCIGELSELSLKTSVFLKYSPPITLERIQQIVEGELEENGEYNGTAVIVAIDDNQCWQIDKKVGGGWNKLS